MKKRFMALAVIVIAALLIPAFKGFSVSAAEDAKVETEVEDTATDLSVKTEVDDPEILPDEGEVTAVDLNPNLWEKEMEYSSASNNTFTTADWVATNTRIGGYLSSSSDVDWYGFTLSKPGSVRLSICHEYIDSSYNYWTLSLYNSKQECIFSGSYEGDVTEEDFSRYVGLDAGDYYVQVSDSSRYSSGVYVIKVNYSASDYWEKEFHETIVTAQPISLETMMYGTIRTSDDKDWYSFTIPSDGYVWVVFGHEYVESSYNHWKTSLYNESNKFIVSYDWEGDDTVDYRTYYFGLEAGTYYLCIEDSSRHTMVPYHFKVRYQKSKAWEKEFNETIVTANSVNVNTYVRGSIMHSSDVDWYKFYVPSSGNIRIAFDHDFVDTSSNSYNHWTASIYDSENKCKTSRYITGDSMSVTYGDAIAVQPGYYYLKVEDASRTTNETYTAIVEYTTNGSFSNISYIDPDKNTPKITMQPSDTTVNPGKLAYFSVKAEGTGLSYLWQYKNAGSSTWTDWTTKTTKDISIAYSPDRNGMSVRCIVKSSDGEKVYSNSATMKYKDGVFFSKQPVSTTVEAGKVAYFSVAAYGSGFKYLWQYKYANDSSWTNWSTKTTADISVAYADYRNGMSLRCLVTDSKGYSALSDVAVLKYNTALSITSQPQNTTVGVNELAYFSVTAKGSGLKYLWQYKEAGKSSWTDWTTKTTASISVAYAASRNGMSLRCVVTDSTGKSVTSNTAVLNYKSKLAITTQPSNATVLHGEVAYFNVKASGSGLKYLWQYKNSGASSWTDWTSKTTASISVAYADYRNNMSLRCVVTDSSGNKVISNTVTLKYKSGIKITAHPENTTVNKQQIAYFGVKAAGNGLKYQWQYKNKGDQGWTTWSSKTTASISVAYADYRNGMSLRCIVTDSDGNIEISNTAVLTYK